MINLNEKEFDAKTVSIFNEGNAGLVENVTLLKIEPKDPNGNAKAPDFKIFFKDEAGNELSFGMYAVDMTREYGQQQLKKQAILLKHFAHTFISKSYEFPIFETPEAMLSGVLRAIKDVIDITKKYRVFTNYGTTMKQSNFINLRNFAPCVEPMTVALEDTRLKASTIEVLQRAQADEISGAVTTNTTTTVQADW